MAEAQSSHRFESNEVIRWSDGFVTVTGVGDPGHGPNADGFETSVLLITEDAEGNRVELDFDPHEAARIARALDRAVAGVNAAA